MSLDAIRTYYDDFSQTYERGRDRGYHALVDDIETSAVLPLARGRDVLEVGCGTGLILSRVAGEARRAVGVDLSPAMLEVARSRGLDVVEGDACALPFPNEAFDVVYAFKVLAHVVDPERAVAEMFRVARPRGHVLVEFYNRRSLRFVARRLGGARRVGRFHRENDIPTRWETVDAVLARLPRGAVLERIVGARVLTPWAGLHRWPLVAPWLARMEKRFAEGLLAPYAGFVVLVARKP